MLVGGLGYGLEVKGVVVNSELVMLRCSWKWKPFWLRDLGGGCLFSFQAAPRHYPLHSLPLLSVSPAGTAAR
jgi:hypothetical protein